MAFAVHYAVALAAVGLMLVGLQTAARVYARRRFTTANANRHVVVLESTALTQQTALHVVRAGSRTYLVGSAQASVTLLAELEVG